MFPPPLRLRNDGGKRGEIEKLRREKFLWRRSSIDCGFHRGRMLFTLAIASRFMSLYVWLSERVITRWHTRAYTSRTANTLVRNEERESHSDSDSWWRAGILAIRERAGGQITRPFCRWHDGFLSFVARGLANFHVFFLFLLLDENGRIGYQ